MPSANLSANFGTLINFSGQQIKARLSRPEVPVQCDKLRKPAAAISRHVRAFSLAVQAQLLKYREDILNRQYVQERIADAASELYVSSCTLSRLDSLLSHSPNGNAAELQRQVQAGLHYLRLSNRRVRQCLTDLNDNDDTSTTTTADAILERF